MKKLTTIGIVVLILIFSCVALAETVYVTISNGQGKIVLPCAQLEVGDADGDGALTLCDALYAAHEAHYDGGAAAGFLAEDQGYGLSIVKLWGEDNYGSYGYYVNNVSAMSLSDPLVDGMHLQVYAYTDLEGWSDTYSNFDALRLQAKAGETISLTLMAQAFDANWAPVTLPVEGAIITIDGEDTAYTTDAEGKVEIQIDAAGEHLISAHSDLMVLVPPVCLSEITE